MNCWSKYGVHEPHGVDQQLVQPCSLRWPNSSKYTALTKDNIYSTKRYEAQLLTVMLCWWRL